MKGSLKVKILLVTIAAILPCAAFAQESFLAGRMSYKLQYWANGRYKVSANVERVQNPLYGFDFSAATVRFAVSDKVYSRGASLHVKTLAQKNLGKLPARSYFVKPISFSGSGQIRIPRGTYALCMLLTEGAGSSARLADGACSSKTLRVTSRGISIQSQAGGKGADDTKITISAHEDTHGKKI